MVPRLTSAKVTDAPATQDAQVLPTNEAESGSAKPSIPESSTSESKTSELSQGALRDARHFREENSRKVIAADVARDLVLQEIVQQARLTTTATGAFVALPRGHKIVSHATSGANAPEFVNELNRHRRMVDACLGSSAVQICKDSETSEDLNASACRYLGARSVVILPILDEADKVLGVFGAFSPQADGFSNANIVALQSLSRRIADAMAQLEKSIAGSVRGGAAILKAEPGESFVAPLRSARRPLAAFRNPAVWGICILALVLALGWTVSRAISRRTTVTAAGVTAAGTTAAAVPQAAPEASQTASQPDSSLPGQTAAPAQTASSAQNASKHASAGAASGNATAVPVKKPVAVTVTKPSATIAPTVVTRNTPRPTPTKTATAKPKPGTQAATRAGANVPDLEIENALDDAGQAPSGQLPSAPAGTFRSPSQPRNLPVPGSIPPSSITPSSSLSRRTTAVNMSAPPTPYNLTPASSPHEAVRITRDPGPMNAASPSPSAPSPAASSPGAPGPNANAPNAPARPGGPVMIPEATALARVVQKVKPDYPEEAMALNVQGAVVVDIVVDRTGLVENATGVDGDARLLAAAVKAARQWQFAAAASRQSLRQL